MTLIVFFSCKLNRTTSKRWEKTTVPTHGSTVLVSGYVYAKLQDKCVEDIRVEVETMKFITPTRGSEVAAFPRTPGKTKFGIPIGFVFIDAVIFSFANLTL